MTACAGRAACIGALTAALLGVAAATPGVPWCGSIAVFAADANGDIEPLRVLTGPGNGLRRPAVIAVDRKGHLYVTNAQNRVADDAVRVFAPDADGDAPARRVIAGPRTGLTKPAGLALDRQGRLYVGSRSSWAASLWSGVAVFEARANGDARPVRTLAGGSIHDHGQSPERLALDSHDSLYVRSGVIAVFAPGATGASEPARHIMRTVPGRQFATIHSPQLFALDRHDTLYAMAGDTVMIYAPGYTGTEPAVRRIAGPLSGVREVTALALDDRGWLYLAERGPRWDAGLVRAYPPGAGGDVPPGRTIQGPRTRLTSPTSIALDGARRLYVANGFGTVEGCAP